MLMRNRSGNPRDELPGEEQDLLKAILQLLIVPKLCPSSVATKKMFQYSPLVISNPRKSDGSFLCLGLFLSRFFKAGVTLGSDSSAMVCCFLPTGIPTKSTD